MHNVYSLFGKSVTLVHDVQIFVFFFKHKMSLKVLFTMIYNML